jgi:hypothetical protein
MEHLDPVGTKWEDLDHHGRMYYRVCVEAILAEYKYPSAVGGPTIT